MVSPRDVYNEWAKQTLASARAGTSNHFYNLAGLVLCIRLHREDLARPFLSAISHLSAKECLNPDYVIDVWDCVDSAASFPRFKHALNDVNLRGEIPLYSGEGVNFAYYAHARMVHILNENERHGIVALKDSRRIPKFELACPFRGIFSWMLRINKMAVIHSAALADIAGNAYLIMGKSGAGKSTTAISCFLSGMKYIGDDLCAIGMRDKKIHIFSIYSSGKTYRSEWRYLPKLAELAEPYVDDDFDKEIYFFGDNASETCASGVLKTIFVPLKDNTSSSRSLPTLASLIATTVESTRQLLPDAGFESLPLLYAAFKQANIAPLLLLDDRRCPIHLGRSQAAS